MSSSLDMSLDDLIKTNKTSGRGGGRGGRSGSGRGGYGGRYGAIRRGFNRQTYRVSPYVKAVPAPVLQQQQILDYGAAAVAAATATAGTSSVELQTGIRLYISNLDANVSTEDLKELFGEVGDLKKCAVHFDSRGRSEGTAEVVFKRKGDGLAAVKRYNSVLLDGKPMKVEVIGGPAAPAPPPPPPPPVRVAPIINPKLLMAPMLRQPQFMGRGGYRGRGGIGAALRGRGGMRGRGRGRGRGGRSSGPQKTAAELDAEMDAYHAAAAMES